MENSRRALAVLGITLVKPVPRPRLLSRLSRHKMYGDMESAPSGQCRGSGSQHLQQGARWQQKHANLPDLSLLSPPVYVIQVTD